VRSGVTWVKDSDDVCHDPALREAGKDAALLWFTLVREAARVGTDGLLTPLMVTDAAHLFSLKARPCVTALIAAGKVHPHDNICGPCMDRSKPVPDGHHLLHGWWDHLLEAAGKDDPIVRKREQRRKALNRNKDLVAAIRQRDQDLCRYCGNVTIDSSGPNKRAARVRQLDHVDPWGDNTFDNVVVACRTCNGRKRDRTPEEAGMDLLDPGTTRPYPAATRPAAGTGPENPAVDPAADLADPALAREAGPGRVGAGSSGRRAGSHLTPVGPGRAS
jgi:5-methylcytosine-specific restriction endonuclease McrA